MTQSVDRDANQALRARFAEVRGQYDQLRADLGELQQRLAAMTVTTESADGLVKVTVGPRGQLMDLSIDYRIYRTVDADELAHTIVTTARAAAASTTEQVHALVSGVLPAESGSHRFLRDGDFGHLLPGQDADLIQTDQPDRR